jgi:hypothetical protein
MEKKQKIDDIRKPIVRYDPALNKKEGVVHHSPKLDELNEKLKNPIFRESLLELMEKYK